VLYQRDIKMVKESVPPTTPHSLVSLANLLRLYLVPLSMLLTKTLNSTCPITDP